MLTRMVGPESLLSVAHEVWLSTQVQDFWKLAFSKDHKYALFEAEDYHAWMTFASVFTCLMVLDHFVLNKEKDRSLDIFSAVRYTLFWILTAFAFCGWIWVSYGRREAMMWMSGYMLEWMLSFDNLFVFHLIFTVYGTPDHLKHRPLYLGICGAVGFRLLFIFIGEYMMHAMVFMHFVFGSFLVYTGIKTLTADEEDEDPSQNPLVKWLQRKVPFVGVYDEGGAFFVQVPVSSDGNDVLVRSVEDSESQQLVKSTSKTEVAYGTVDFVSEARKLTARGGERQRYEIRATMLFLVVCCLEISDIVFAVDSVSAIVAQVNDLFLAYTSAVFAMLGLRATFFIIDVLVHTFEYLKYGVSAVLVFIGVKLILAHHYDIEPHTVVFVLISCIGASMLASVLKAEMEKKALGYAPQDVQKRVEQVKEKTSPITSPFLPSSLPGIVLRADGLTIRSASK
eukprot:TRINITY_DN107081_c0_g1_i1.p1 TRINITY_DN107081_c0_g1~~TRINITY_DN107081_c0_g1_i1.p1  ORF type:complete len:452 (-),score=104.32 TRINITY_DN107081_c0_g1_i1:146-1501(-)